MIAVKHGYHPTFGFRKLNNTDISHDSESRTLVYGHKSAGSYSRDVHYTGASLSQLVSLTRVSSHCEQFIKYECHHSVLLGWGGYAWWVARDSTKMTYWGGATPGSDKCACGMTNSCADPTYSCNCDKTTCGVKTAVYSRTSQIFPYDSLGLEIRDIAYRTKGITLLEN